MVQKKITSYVKKNLNEIIIFFVVLVFSVLFSQVNGEIDFSRIALTRSIVDNGTFSINSFYNNTIDRSYIDGDYYSDKSPYLSFLSVPLYSLYKTIFGTPSLMRQGYVWSSSLVFALTFLFSSLPAAGLTTIFYKISYSKTKNQKFSLMLSFCLFFCTPVFTYSRQFIPYMMSALALFFSFYLLNQKKPRKNSFLIGSLLAFSFGVEYTTLPAIILLGLYSLKKISPKKIFFGFLAGLLPLLVYNWVIIGNPFLMTNFFLDPEIWEQSNTFLSQFQLNPWNILNICVRILFYPFRGLFFYSPILLFSIPFLYYGVKKKEKKPLLVLGMLLFYILMITQLKTWWGGGVFQERFFTTIMPFLFLPLINMEKKMKRIEIFLLFFVLVATSLFVNLIGVGETKDIPLDNQSLTQDYLVKFKRMVPFGNPLFSLYVYPNYEPIFLTILGSMDAFMVTNLLYIGFIVAYAIIFFSYSKPNFRNLSLFVFSVVLFFFLWHSYLRISYAYDITTADGFVLGFSLDLFEGNNIYTDISQTLKPNVYPPLYYIFTLPLLAITGPSFLSGKIITFFASLLSGALIYFICKQKTDKYTSMIISLSFFCFYHVFFWSTIPRPDMLGLFFSLLGLYWFTEKKSRWQVSIALAMSFFTKQHFIAVSIAILFYLIFNKKKKKLLDYGKSLFVVFSFFLALFYLFFGPNFILNVFIYSFSSLPAYKFILIYVFLFSILPLLFFIPDLLSNDIFTAYFFVSLVLMLILFNNPGAASNYFLEPVTAILLLYQKNPLKKKKYLISLLLLVQIFFSLGGGILSSPWENIGHLNSFVDNIEEDNHLMNYVNNSKKRIFSESSGYLLMSGNKASPDVWKLYDLKYSGVINEKMIASYCRDYDIIISFFDMDKLSECFRGLNISQEIDKRYLSSIRYTEGNETTVIIYER